MNAKVPNSMAQILEILKPVFFSPEVPTLMLWNPLHDVLEIKDVQASDYLGLMKTLDIRAKGRGEPDLPRTLCNGMPIKVNNVY